MMAAVEIRPYGLACSMSVDVPQAISQVKAALQEQGFGVLTEIDVAGTLKAKLGVDMPSQVILGACHPQFAYQALQADPDVSLLLPCNVVVRQIEGGTEVVAVDPQQMLAAAGPSLQALAADVRGPRAVRPAPSQQRDVTPSPGQGHLACAWNFPSMLAPMGEDILARLFTALNTHGVRYALFGGLAVGAHGLARATKDVDLFLDTGDDNVAALLSALRSVFDDPAVEEITSEDLHEYGLVRYGVRDFDFVIDLTQRIGEMFRYDNLEIEIKEMLGVPVPVVSARTLIRMKRDTRRPQDQLDVARLRDRFGIEDL